MSGSKQGWTVSANRVAGETKSSIREPFFKRMLRKVFPDQRKELRVAGPPLRGYLGTAHGSRPFEVGDVSLGGFSLVTQERWLPGTEMPITLERMNVAEGEPRDRFTVQATAVRWTEDGVGFSIVLFEEESQAVFGNPLQVHWVSRQEMKLFLDRLKAPETMVTTAPGQVTSDGDLSLREALHARFHVSPHTAGD